MSPAPASGLVTIRRGRRFSQATLAAATAATIAGFGAAGIYSELRLQRVDTGLDRIADDAIPAVLTLDRVRAGIREVEATIRSSDASATAPRTASEIASLHAQWRSYCTAYAVDEDRARAVDRAFDALERMRQHRVDVSGPLAMDADVSVGLSTLRSLLDERAGEVSVMARRAEGVRMRTSHVALVIDSITVALGVLVTVLASWALRRNALALELRADELEAFAARVAHDLRGPLGPALFALRRLSEATGERPELERIGLRGERSLRAVEALVTDLYAFARSGGPPDPSASASVRDTIDDVLLDVRPLATEARVDIEVEPFAERRIACAPGVAASVVGNLVRNAVSHMEDAPTRRVMIRVAGTARRVTIDVADTGPGIPDSMRDHIFSPYAKAVGSAGIGLGLATAHRLVKAHGGSIEVHAREGGGTLFCVRMPAARG